MKKLLVCIIVIVTMMSVSCSNETFDDVSIPNTKVLVSNSKFTCYTNETTTRSAIPQTVNIVVNELPGYEILSSVNKDANKNEFNTKSIFIKNGNPIFEMYSNTEEREDGWVVRYKCVGGDEDIEFLPKELARSRASWGEKTSNCLQDVYANHGWVSVWAAIQTGFIPWTGVAFAAVCAAKNY